MDTEQTKKTGQALIKKIIAALKKYWFFLLIGLVCGASIGGILSTREVPTYTAYETVDYTAKNIAETSENAASHVTGARTYITTVVEFARQGCVGDRANFYYDEFLSSGKTIEEFLFEHDNERKTRETYTFDQLASGEMLGGLYDVFYNASSDGVNFYRSFYTGRLYAFDNQKVTFKNGNTEFSIFKDSYVTSQKSDVYRDEFTYDEIVCVKDRNVKVYYYEGNSNLNPKTVTGKIISFSEESITVKKQDESEIIIARDKYKTGKLVASTNIYASGIMLNYSARTDSFIFDVSYTDTNKNAVANKVKIAILAINDEAHVYKNVTTGGTSVQYKYFKVIRINIDDMSLRYIKTNDGRRAMILRAGLIGLVAGAVVIYVLSVMDRTVKSKEELEEITGVSLLTYISKQEEKSNG